MIQLIAQYPALAGSDEDLDALVDALMEVLLDDPAILDPGVALNLEARVFEIQLVVDTDDYQEAIRIGSPAAMAAVQRAGVTGGQVTRHYVHQNLLKTPATRMELEAV